ncbi:hypothetical protein BDA99DRAFT_540772 [Phascolomyces articulosus]|uniref:Rieske domain-containing protein n=1 Tax=Phascolomyces articulosus TaxID=60185 RepID=A0AAD5K3F6_9FUNG|nr:hypothetical protein BDA99DRAFT_540772 [Phascolomyces articulosus]
MGKNKGGFSLLESYMMANANSTETSENGNGQSDAVPLPESMRASTLLEQIGKERSWTDEQIDHDIDILDNNRLYFVRDLRSLSNQSWTVIGLLPLVRDLLRRAIDPEWETKESVDSYKEYKDKKKKKKEMKKKKKYQKMTLGDPVSPMRIEAEGDTLAQDPETLRNTILNGSIDVGLADVGNRSMDMDLNNNNGTSQQQKTVSFTDNALVGVAATEGKVKDKKKKKKMMEMEASSSSSSSSSSCSSEEDEMTTATTSGTSLNGQQQKPKTFTGRPITPVSSNRIQVRTASGDTYECDRFCPHKGVDLSTWGQVLGNKLVCTKHNWSFSLEGSGIGPKGRSVHPCRVNDW